MKRIFYNKKLLLLLVIFFLCVFANTFLCYLVSYFARTNSNMLYVLVSFIVILTTLTAVIMIHLLRKFSNEINAFVFAVSTIFAVAIIDTFIFKILSITSSKDLVLKTGFVSLILLFFYFGIILLISLLPIKKKKEAKVLEEKKI